MGAAPCSRPGLGHLPGARGGARPRRPHGRRHGRRFPGGHAFRTSPLEARRADLVAILARLEVQMSVAARMSEMAGEWRTEAAGAVRDAAVSHDPELKRRAREALHVAVGVASDADGV